MIKAMKRIIIVLAIVAVISLIMACASQSSQITEVVVLSDITDRHLTQPKAEEILTLFNPQSKWDGRVFLLGDLTDVSYNQVKEVRLEAQNEWLSNELDRGKEIKQFNNSVSEIISNDGMSAEGKGNSSVYFPIAKELNRLSQSSSTNKVLLIYSDLMENTREMSFYDERKFNLLKANPDPVKKYFDAQVELRSLAGIKVYIIFQPSGVKEDEQFRVVSGFYKKLLEDKGATVEITASTS